MATAELAACLPVLALLVAAAMSVVSVASVQVRAQDAAREAARAAARGDDAAAARLAAAALPAGRLRLSTDGDEITAIVTVRAELPVPFLPSVSITEQAVAEREPS